LKNNYITSSCVISNNTVCKNGKNIFKDQGAGLPDFLFSLYKHLEINYGRFYKMDTLCKLGWLASEVLLKDSFDKNIYKPEEIGLVLSNANSSLDTDLRYMESVKDIASPSLFVYTLPNILTGEICIRNNFKGEDGFFVFERFNPEFVEFYVNNLLDNNILEACICGWVDVLGDEYKATMFLVEKKKGEETVTFTKKEMERIFEKDEDVLQAKNEVYVAGLGVISAIGNNVRESLDSLANRKAGMGDITQMNTIHRNKLLVAEVKLTNEELVKITGLSPDISRTTLLGLIAAKEALHDAGITELTSLRTGIISANTVGGMDKTEDFFIPFLKNNKQGKLKFIFDHECGSVTEHIADNLGIKHFITTLSTACSSSANAIFYAARLIKNDLLDVAVAGGADALTKFTLNGFNTLMILDEEYCKPFDENRKGLNLGEGAGYVVLVSEKVAKTLKKKMYCKLSGYNNSNDAYHQTASSPDGTGSYLAMKRALEKANLTTADIDYINLHGTGTPNNDSAEGTAIKRLFDPHYPPMSSTKSFTGHTLGASGAIEAVFSVLAIANGIVYPNLRLETPMVDFPFTPETEFLTAQKVNHVMSNSFGFGGNCTSLIFSRI